MRLLDSMTIRIEEDEECKIPDVRQRGLFTIKKSIYTDGRSQYYRSCYQSLVRPTRPACLSYFTAA